MTTYIYEETKTLSNYKMTFIAAVKESKLTDIVEKLAYILEWFSIGA